MSISMTVSVWGFSWSTSSMRCFAFFSFSHCTASAVTPATSTSPTCLFSWYFCFPSDFILFFWLYLNEMPSDAVVRPWRTQQLWALLLPPRLRRALRCFPCLHRGYTNAWSRRAVRPKLVTGKHYLEIIVLLQCLNDLHGALQSSTDAIHGFSLL